MKIYGLIGYPLGHSFSASYFSDKFVQEGIEAEYRNFPLEDISAFASLAKEVTDLAGLNVTVPFKQRVMPYLHALSDTAEKIGAVNTISFLKKEGQLELRGDNTDVVGFRRSLEEHLHRHHDSALVLGTGGSSKAVCFVLEQMGMKFTRVSRRAGKNRISYAELNKEAVAHSHVIINTTPLGMYPLVKDCPDIPYAALTSRHLLFDLVYNPALTRFLERGKKQGAQCVNGYDMLVYQAEASWEIWNT